MSLIRNTVAAFPLLLCLIQVGHCQTLESFRAAVSKLQADSPAGGPSKNSDAAVFVLFRKSEKLGWIDSERLVTVDVVTPNEKDDKREFGITPVGEFLVGLPFKHPKHECDWCKLYPRIEDNSGYYGYGAQTKMGRFAMGLHPGRISQGCVTVKSELFPYDSNVNWKKVREILNSRRMKYKSDDFCGFLFVIDE